MPRILSQKSWIDKAQAILQEGNVVALPFERLFGLAANALSADAVDKVCAIKNRCQDAFSKQPISVIAPTMESLALVTDGLTENARELAARFWPGPLTILVKACCGLPAPLVSSTGLIGVRIAGPCRAAELAARANMVLTATSANLSGNKDAMTHRDLMDLFGLDAVVEGEVDGPPGSTVVDCSGPSPKVLRQGCIAIERV